MDVSNEGGSVKVYIASDHAGFADKQLLVKELMDEYDVVDLGPEEFAAQDDYPVYAQKVASSVAANNGSFGILLCRSGEGMQIAANKVDGARAALVWNTHLARETRADNDSNIVVLPTGEIDFAMMIDISREFLLTKFSEAERHQRRIEEVSKIEQGKELS